MAVVQEPSRELRRLATRIDFGLGRYLLARGHEAVGSRWESLRHAWTLSNLTLRQAESVCVLAKTDEVLLPAGWVTARAALETAARLVWLLEPEDEWGREARWLALLQEGARLDARNEVLTLRGRNTPTTTLKDFADLVTAKLPDGVKVPGIPPITSMLETQQGVGLVGLYAVASQFTHGAELASRQWRTNLGVDAGYGEVVSSLDWVIPLSAAFQAFRVTTTTLMRAVDKPLPQDVALVEQQINKAREALIDAADKR